MRKNTFEIKEFPYNCHFPKCCFPEIWRQLLRANEFVSFYVGIFRTRYKTLLFYPLPLPLLMFIRRHTSNTSRIYEIEFSNYIIFRRSWQNASRSTSISSLINAAWTWWTFKYEPPTLLTYVGTFCPINL